VNGLGTEITREESQEEDAEEEGAAGWILQEGWKDQAHHQRQGR